MYKALVFDFDGTIIDTEKHLYDIINKHLSFHGVKPVSLEFYRSHIGGHAQGLHDYIEQQIGLEKKQKYMMSIMIRAMNSTLLIQFLH